VTNRQGEKFAGRHVDVQKAARTLQTAAAGDTRAQSGHSVFHRDVVKFATPEDFGTGLAF